MGSTRAASAGSSGSRRWSRTAMAGPAGRSQRGALDPPHGGPVGRHARPVPAVRHLLPALPKLGRERNSEGCVAATRGRPRRTRQARPKRDLHRRHPCRRKKKGVRLWEKLVAELPPRSWRSQTALVFLYLPPSLQVSVTKYVSSTTPSSSASPRKRLRTSSATKHTTARSSKKTSQRKTSS